MYRLNFVKKTFAYKSCLAHKATQHATDWMPPAVSGPDGRILSTLGTNQIARFVEYRPLTHWEKTISDLTRQLKVHAPVMSIAFCHPDSPLVLLLRRYQHLINLATHYIWERSLLVQFWLQMWSIANSTIIQVIIIKLTQIHIQRKIKFFQYLYSINPSQNKVCRKYNTNWILLNLPTIHFTMP